MYDKRYKGKKILDELLFFRLSNIYMLSENRDDEVFVHRVIVLQEIIYLVTAVTTVYHILRVLNNGFVQQLL